MKDQIKIKSMTITLKERKTGNVVYNILLEEGFPLLLTSEPELEVSADFEQIRHYSDADQYELDDLEEWESDV